MLYRQTLKRIAAHTDPYHPLEIAGTVIGQGERACADRWAIIHEEMLSRHAVNVLDLGCAEGYFVQKAAASGYLAFGVDADVTRLALGTGSTLLGNRDRAGFMYAQITPEFIAQLPIFDVVLFQSVLHHVMYLRSVEYAREIMVSLRAKVGKVLIFDTGQSDETNNKWAKYLPDMGSDPHSWIADFVRSAGFSTVEKVAESDSYRSTTKRALFRLLP